MTSGLGVTRPVPAHLPSAGVRGEPLPRAQVLLVCSPGGHLLQLLSMRPAWNDFTHVWVTLDRSDSRSLLHDQRTVYAYGPTFRNVKNLARNLLLAWRVIGAVRPAVILTTGAALAVPFAWIGRLRGSRVVYVESFTRVSKPSLSCRLVKPAANRLYVQWPDLQRALPSARYVGNLFSAQ
jgi:beta-1,4-N-acetylglucosaminyltransferase